MYAFCAHPADPSVFPATGPRAPQEGLSPCSVSESSLCCVPTLTQAQDLGAEQGTEQTSHQIYSTFKELFCPFHQKATMGTREVANLSTRTLRSRRERWPALNAARGTPPTLIPP